MTWDSSDHSDDTCEPVPQAPVPWISPFVLSSVLRRGSTKIATVVQPEDSPFDFSSSGRSLALLEHSAFKLLDAFCQPGQAAELADLFLYFLERPGRSAPHDLLATYEELKGKGVIFTKPPKKEFYGYEALFKDDSGNWFSLGEKGK